jgi:hypothetical protein
LIEGGAVRIKMEVTPMMLTIELPEEQEAALTARAQAQGVSAEEYARRVLQHDLEDGQERLRRPMSEVMREIWGDMPEDVRAKLPRDGASQVDHYVYGLPKRDE